MTATAQSIKDKINKLDFIKIKKLPGTGGSHL
jgi:hypothetical protein